MFWRRIPVTKADIELKTLLKCGQSFTWKETSENVWSNVVENTIFSLSQTESEILWCTPARDELKVKLQVADAAKNGGLVDIKNEVEAELLQGKQVTYTRGKRKAKVQPKVKVKSENQNVRTDTDIHIDSPYHHDSQACASSTELESDPPATKCIKLESLNCHSLMPSDNINIDNDEHYENLLKDYFQLNIDLPNLYKQWSSADSHFQKIAGEFPGIRIMRQDPTENLFSFICSSNNHVSRISGMVQKLSEHYGTELGSVSGIHFYSFPTADKLDGPKVEGKLRELGFGYRAKYIAVTAKILHTERPEGWLNSLRECPYEECVRELTKLQGVGRKVADCIALMSLDKAHVVPVDTHVLQIAIRDYRIPGVSKDMKSLTPTLHDKIGKYFVDLYGEYAGWAHTVLFAADLKRFSDHKPVGKKKPSTEKKVEYESKVKSAAEGKVTSADTLTGGGNKVISGSVRSRKQRKL